MSFTIRDAALHAEHVPLSTIADEVGTPTYVYSTAAICAAARRFRTALAGVPDAQYAFAAKANPAPALLSLLAGEGYGADIVSQGEMRAALRAGMSAQRLVYSGVGKTEAELRAALDAGIGRFNLELEEEGVLLSALSAARGLRAPVLLRVNPHVDAHTHAKITTGTSGSKFGVAIDEVPGMYDRLARLPGLDLGGLSVHIGSQIVDLAPLEATYRQIGHLVATLRARGHRISHVDLGGGLGVSYRPDQAEADVEAYGAMVSPSRSQMH